MGEKVFRDLAEQHNIYPGKDTWEYKFLERRGPTDKLPPEFLDDLWIASDKAGRKTKKSEDDMEIGDSVFRQLAEKLKRYPLEDEWVEAFQARKGSKTSVPPLTLRKIWLAADISGRKPPTVHEMEKKNADKMSGLKSLNGILLGLFIIGIFGMWLNGGEFNPRKTLEGVAVVERVFERLVSEGIPLLEKIDAQHPLISINDSHPLTGTGTTISDAYSLGGVTAPPSPYTGSFNGPGALLGDSPTRTTASETVAIIGSRTLEAQVYALRLGPYFEFPFGKHWSGRVGGGLALGVANTKYSYNETISFGGGQTVNNSGSSEGASFQAGGYLEGKLLYAVTPRASLFAGAQYENLGTFSHNAGNEQAQLDLSSTVYVLFGVQFNF